MEGKYIKYMYIHVVEECCSIFYCFPCNINKQLILS